MKENNSDKKEQLRKYEKKEKFMCDNLNDMKKDR